MTPTPTTTKTKTTTKAKRAEIPAAIAADSSMPLEALVGDLPTGPRLVALDNLVDHPKNPRKSMLEEDLAALADSIKAQGVRQNLLVVPDPGAPDRHMIVIGHRRAAAARLAGLDVVPAIVDPTLTDVQQLELMLVENMQRSDLTIVEEADGLQGLLDLGMSKAEIQKQTGVGRTKLAGRLSVARLPESGKTAVADGKATLEDVLALSEFEDDPETHEKLSGLLGDRDFGWQLRNAQADRKQAVEVAEARALCEPRGISVEPRGSGEPEGWRYFRPEIRADELAAWLEENPDLGGDAVALRHTRGWFWQYRPATATPVDPEAAAREAESDAERERARLIYEEAQSAAGLASDARREFLLRFTKSQGKLTAKQTENIARFFASEILEVFGGSNYGTSDLQSTLEWLGIEPPEDGDDEPESYQPLLDAVPLGRLYLAIAASTNEGFPEGGLNSFNRWDNPVRWMSAGNVNHWTEDARVCAWYYLLHDLGYDSSQWELDRLVGAPLPEPTETGTESDTGE